MDTIRYELLKTRLEIYEETFRNIYSEIHDNVGQQLSVCRLYLSSVEERLTKPDNEKVGDVRLWLGQSISDLRNICRERTEELITRAGLLSAIGVMLGNAQKRFTIDLQLESGRDYIDPPPEEAVIIYGMVQEALNNAIRHARAREVRIRFDVEGCRWTAEIRDDGCGYDTTATHTGRGLHNLRQRAKLLSAKLNVVSIQGTGTVVYLSLPIKLVT